MSAHSSVELANAYGNLGIVHMTRGDLDEAEAVYRKSLALNEELGFPDAHRIRKLLLEIDPKMGTPSE